MTHICFAVVSPSFTAEELEVLEGDRAVRFALGSQVRGGALGALGRAVLEVWNMNFIFPYIGKITPTDFHIFQRGGSTTNQLTNGSLDRRDI